MSPATSRDLVRDLGSLGRTVGLVLLGWVLLLGVVLALGWLVTGPLEPTVDPWDDEIARDLAAARTEPLSALAEVGTRLGDTKVGMAFAALAGLVFSVWRRTWVPALFVVVLALGLGGFYSVATRLITRDRPPVRILDPGLVPDHSFPSGHVATATGVYGAILVLAWLLAPAARGWVWVLGLLPPLEVFARLYQGAHHVTDTLVSLGYATGWLAVLTVVVLRPGMARWGRPPPGAAPSGSVD